MPCSDTSSSICLYLNPEERFISFEYAKITCGREITAETGLSRILFDKTLEEILNTSFENMHAQVNPQDEEASFILYLEWDALRCAIAEYLADARVDVDRDRCQITNIEHHDKGYEIALVILPPKELPKILPCSIRANK